MAKFVINGDPAVASRWFDDSKLMLNPKKCKCIILPKSYPCDLSFSISDVSTGSYCSHLELLGVTIDNSLNFSKHIGKIIYNRIGKIIYNRSTNMNYFIYITHY